MISIAGGIAAAPEHRPPKDDAAKIADA